jgi:hypothetical protein
MRWERDCSNLERVSIMILDLGTGIPVELHGGLLCSSG